MKLVDLLIIPAVAIFIAATYGFRKGSDLVESESKPKRVLGWVMLIANAMAVCYVLPVAGRYQ